MAGPPPSRKPDFSPGGPRSAPGARRAPAGARSGPLGAPRGERAPRAGGRGQNAGPDDPALAAAERGRGPSAPSSPRSSCGGRAIRPRERRAASATIRPDSAHGRSATGGDLSELSLGADVAGEEDAVLKPPKPAFADFAADLRQEGMDGGVGPGRSPRSQGWGRRAAGRPAVRRPAWTGCDRWGILAGSFRDPSGKLAGTFREAGG